jgi:DNA-binding response OmpR family regulator
MRMEHDVAGVEVIKAARAAAYHPAVALLTAFPVAEEDWQEMGADQLLVKPMHTRILLQQIEDLIASHEQKLAKLGVTSAAANTVQPATAKKKPAKKAPTKKPAAKKAARKTLPPAKRKVVANGAASNSKKKSAGSAASAKKSKPSLGRKS